MTPFHLPFTYLHLKNSSFSDLSKRFDDCCQHLSTQERKEIEQRFLLFFPEIGSPNQNDHQQSIYHQHLKAEDQLRRCNTPDSAEDLPPLEELQLHQQQEHQQQQYQQKPEGNQQQEQHGQQQQQQQQQPEQQQERQLGAPKKPRWTKYHLYNPLHDGSGAHNPFYQRWLSAQRNPEELQRRERFEAKMKQQRQQRELQQQLRRDASPDSDSADDSGFAPGNHDLPPLHQRTRYLSRARKPIRPRQTTPVFNGGAL